MKKLIILIMLLVGLCIAEVKHQYFGTVDDMVTVIEQLNDYEYSTLRIFVKPSSRGTGMFGRPYNIIYKTQ